MLAKRACFYSLPFLAKPPIVCYIKERRMRKRPPLSMNCCLLAYILKWIKVEHSIASLNLTLRIERYGIHRFGVC